MKRTKEQRKRQVNSTPRVTCFVGRLLTTTPHAQGHTHCHASCRRAPAPIARSPHREADNLLLLRSSPRVPNTANAPEETANGTAPDSQSSAYPFQHHAADSQSAAYSLQRHPANPQSAAYSLQRHAAKPPRSDIPFARLNTS